MPANPIPTPIRLIESQAALDLCLDDLYNHEELALDLEFDSHSYAYGVTLALIQIASTDTCYLIDPFAPLDLNGVYDLLEDERIVKIMHSPGEDLRLLHSLDCLPKNLFDTEIAARLLNYELTSLSAMLEAKLGYLMSKKQQRSNWLIRPLTQEQITYAAADVTSLHALKALLVGELRDKNLEGFVTEEQELLSTTIYQAEPKTFFLKRADLHLLSPYDQYVLNELLIYRDALSQQLNKPAYKVIDELIIREIASGAMHPDELSTARSVHPSLKSDRAIDELILKLESIRKEATRNALSREIPSRKKLTDEERRQKDRAERDKREKFSPIQAVVAERFGVFAARFIMSNSLVSDLLDGSITISSMKQNYRRKLIEEIAAAMAIDLSQYT